MRYVTLSCATHQAQKTGAVLNKYQLLDTGGGNKIAALNLELRAKYSIDLSATLQDLEHVAAQGHRVHRFFFECVHEIHGKRPMKYMKWDQYVQMKRGQYVWMKRDQYV